jgi:hypothetical protein
MSVHSVEPIPQLLFTSDIAGTRPCVGHWRSASAGVGVLDAKDGAYPTSKANNFNARVDSVKMWRFYLVDKLRQDDLVDFNVIPQTPLAVERQILGQICPVFIGLSVDIRLVTAIEN